MFYSFSRNSTGRLFSSAKLFVFCFVATFKLTASVSYMLQLPGADGRLYSVHPEGLAGNQLYSELTRMQSEGITRVGLTVIKNPNSAGVSYSLSTEGTPPADASPYYLSFHLLEFFAGETFPRIVISNFPDSSTNSFLLPFSDYPVPFPSSACPCSDCMLQYQPPFSPSFFPGPAAFPSSYQPQVKEDSRIGEFVSAFSCLKLFLSNADISYCKIALKFLSKAPHSLSSENSSENTANASLIDFIRQVPVGEIPELTALCNQRIATLQAALQLSLSPEYAASVPTQENAPQHEQSPHNGVSAQVSAAHSEKTQSSQQSENGTSSGLGSPSPLSRSAATIEATSCASSSPVQMEKIEATNKDNQAGAPASSAVVSTEKKKQTSHNPSLGAWQKKPDFSQPSAVPVMPTPPHTSSNKATVAPFPAQSSVQVPHRTQHSKKNNPTPGPEKSSARVPAQPQSKSVQASSASPSSKQNVSVPAAASQPNIQPKVPQPAKQKKQDDFFLQAAAATSASTNEPSAFGKALQQAPVDPSRQEEKDAAKAAYEKALVVKKARAAEREERKRKERALIQEIRTALENENFSLGQEKFLSLNPEASEYVSCLVEIIQTGEQKEQKITETCIQLEAENTSTRKLSKKNLLIILRYLYRTVSGVQQDKYLFKAMEAGDKEAGLRWYKNQLIAAFDPSGAPTCQETKECIHISARKYHNECTSSMHTNPLLYAVEWLLHNNTCRNVEDHRIITTLNRAQENLSNDALFTFIEEVKQYPKRGQLADTPPTISISTEQPLPVAACLEQLTQSYADQINKIPMTKQGSAERSKLAKNFLASLPSFLQRARAAEILLPKDPLAALVLVMELLKDESLSEFNALRLAQVFHPHITVCRKILQELKGSQETSSSQNAVDTFIKSLDTFEKHCMDLINPQSKNQESVQEMATCKDLSELFMNINALPNASSRKKFIEDSLPTTLEKVRTEDDILSFLAALQHHITHSEHSQIVQFLLSYLQKLSDKKMQGLWYKKMDIITFKSLNMQQGTSFFKITTLFEKELSDYIGKHITENNCFQNAGGLVLKLLRRTENFGEAYNFILKKADAPEAPFYWAGFCSALKERENPETVIAPKAIHRLAERMHKTIEEQLELYGETKILAEFVSRLKELNEIRTKSMRSTSQSNDQPALAAALPPVPPLDYRNIAVTQIVKYQKAFQSQAENKQQHMDDAFEMLRAKALGIKLEADAQAFADIFSRSAPRELKKSFSAWLQSTTTLPSTVYEILAAACFTVISYENPDGSVTIEA